MTQLEILEQHKSFNGQQIKYKHHSEVLGCDMKFELYIPDTDQAVPLIWFLAGLSSTEENFTHKAGFQRYAAERGYAFIMPDTSPRGEDVPEGDNWDIGTGAGFYINATEEPWNKHFKMYDYLTQELPEIVHEIIPNFNGQEAIMGHSMGGYGALLIGMKNPDRFTSISAFAPITNPTKVPWGQKAFTTYLGEDESKWKEWDPVELIKAADDLPPVYITQGTADDFYEVQLVEDTFLAAAEGKDVTYETKEGYDHNYYFIATFVEDHIDFHHKHFQV